MFNINYDRKPYPLGAHPEAEGIRFAFVSRQKPCGILLFDRKTGRKVDRLPFGEEERVGNIYCKYVPGLNPAEITYQFYCGDRILPDMRARVFPGRAAYGKERPVEKLKAGFLTSDFDWGGDRCPRIPYDRALVYCMHVRGFTRHSSSGVKNRGTFAGIAEKVPYLKEIGVTTLELQPAYEFTELQTGEELQDGIDREAGAGLWPKRLNYWGYKRGFYYAPKAAYAGGEDPTVEFKELVKTLHANGMELVMQMYFPAEVKRNEIPEILRFWVLEYHVDGFHLLGEDMPAEDLAQDDALTDTKLWYYHFDPDRICQNGQDPAYPQAAEYNDGWYYDMRRFLKGDEGMLDSFLYHMRHIPERAGEIHYLTNYYGFTLADLVSYDYKHNEANGEDNRDGSNYNGSWNCGEEGAARRGKVRSLRIRQIKNAMCMLLLSQSTPLIFMGDEFGNSQKGNNNPYCQDNSVTWLDWRLVEKNREIWEFWKKLIEFRRQHPILHPERALRLMDSLACGYPDLSYHGQNAWRPQTENYFRHVGIMLCEKYAPDGGDGLLYLAVNMHWESHELALPRPPKGTCWKEVFSTEDREEISEKGLESPGEELVRRVPARSIAVYVSEPVIEEKPAAKKKGPSFGRQKKGSKEA